MNKVQQSDQCKICGVPTGADEGFCAECASALGPPAPDESAHENAQVDLEVYSGGNFPWEQTRKQPRLINSKTIWLVLAIALVVIVVLLALVRAPLPSCWELS
jgi:predicted nucleic acid-binding Zn ribbon protein